MKLIDKYIIKKVLSTFFFVALILIAIIVVINMTENIEKFLTNNLSSAQIAFYYLNFIPWITAPITPIIAFIATVYVTSVMASHTEIIAILSGGVSFKRLLLPYIMAALVIASLSFYLNGWVIPKSNRARLAFELQYFKSKTYDRRDIHFQIEPNVYLYMQNYNSMSNTGYQFSLERFMDNKLIEKMSAQNITWDSTKTKWVLHDWERRDIEGIFKVNEVKDRARLVTMGAALDTTLNMSPKDFENDDRKYDGMTLNELNDYIGKLKFRGASGVEFYEVEKQVRFASPFSILILICMAVIVSSRKSRGGTGFQIALGFMLSFIFIIFFTMSRTFAETGGISAMVAVWTPNITFILIALGLYKYTPR